MKNKYKKAIEIPAVGNLYGCKCRKKILVERGLMGIDHDWFIVANCWDCIDPEYKKEAVKKYKLKINLTGRRNEK